MAKDLLGMATDENRNPIQRGGSFQTSDGAATAKVSPLAYTVAIQTITVPSNAAEVVFKPSTDMRISALATMGNFFVITAGSVQALGVTKMDSFFISRDTVDGTLNFYFILV